MICTAVVCDCRSVVAAQVQQKQSVLQPVQARSPCIGPRIAGCISNMQLMTKALSNYSQLLLASVLLLLALMVEHQCGLLVVKNIVLFC